MGIRDYAYHILEQSKREMIYKKPPRFIRTLLNQIELYEVYPKIFAVAIANPRLRSRVFLRYQEFYESDSDSFRGKSFKWEDFIKYYKEKTKQDYFSYHEDWAGYNIPCDTIEACAAKIPDLNIYDMMMFSIRDTIKNIVGNSPYYLIGIDSDQSNDLSLTHHEVAHALWFLDPNYKKQMTRQINTMEENVKERLLSILAKYGYGDNVLLDEIQAYMATGLGDGMNRIKNIKKAQIPFHNIFMKYTSNIQPKKIPIDWSTDLDR